MNILQNNQNTANPKDATLSKRLLAVASYVNIGKESVDVGTDHAYLPVYLYQKGITQSIVACDINEKPLETAKRTIKEAGLDGLIKLRLSNGLEKIKKQEAQNIIICGMGGELILQILLESPFEIDQAQNLILQPMTNLSFLRKGLYENGFEILSETPILEGRHFYTVLQAKKAENIKNEKLSDEFFLVGKIPESDSEDKNKYIKHIIKKQGKIAEGLKKAKNGDDSFLFYEQIAENLKKLLKDKEA